MSRKKQINGRGCLVSAAMVMAILFCSAQGAWGVTTPISISWDYENVVDEVCAFFEERLTFCEEQGISSNKIILDPGIGFGKSVGHNLALIKDLKEFHRFGCPLLLGASRKSYIGAISGEDEPKNRLAGSLSTAIYELDAGAQIFRVHDVKETCQAFDVYNAIKKAD